MIAANTMAKRAGVTTGMAIADARRRCPGIALVPQQPDLYTRTHYAPNLWLAKIAADLDKPDGLTVLHPRDLPGRLLTLDLEDLPTLCPRRCHRIAMERVPEPRADPCRIASTGEDPVGGHRAGP